MPAMSTYNLLVGYIRSLGGNLEIGQNPGGSLTKCAIVSTFFQKEGRSFGNFDDFHDFRPHRVIGSTAVATPTAGEQLYFDEDVLPSLIQESSSRDGGVLWADVESGVYEIRATPIRPVTPVSSRPASQAGWSTPTPLGPGRTRRQRSGQPRRPDRHPASRASHLGRDPVGERPTNPEGLR